MRKRLALYRPQIRRPEEIKGITRSTKKKPRICWEKERSLLGRLTGICGQIKEGESVSGTCENF
jgi:hypothetical protein